MQEQKDLMTRYNFIPRALQAKCWKDAILTYSMEKMLQSLFTALWIILICESNIGWVVAGLVKYIQKKGCL